MPVLRLLAVLFALLLLFGCDEDKIDASLSSLTLSAGALDPAFQSDQYDYTATVDAADDSITVMPTASNPDASITVNGTTVVSGTASAPIALAEGDNEISIVVTAADGSTTRTYTVTVTRPAGLSAEASLSALSLSGGDLDQIFQSTLLDYTASVGFLQSSVTVTPTGTDASASITVDGEAVASGTASSPIALAEGENAIAIVVTAEDGVTTQTYTLTVTRASADSFAQQAYLKAGNAEAGDQFGFSIAIDGDTLVVGATHEDGDANSTAASPNDDASSAGAVYVFTRAGGVWSQQGYLKAGNAEMGDEFGYSIAIDGDTLAVGTLGEDGDASSTAASPNNNATDAGAVYVFTRSSGVWSQQAYLKASNAAGADGFGRSIDLDADTLVVGAFGEDGLTGAAYVFIHSGGTWSQQAYLKAGNAGGVDAFGYSIAIDGDTLAVGAISEDGDAGSTAASPNNNAINAGAVYVFTRSGGVWSQQAYLKAGNAEAGDRFGGSIDLDGDTLVVGATSEDGDATSTAASPNDDATDAGAAYVFIRSGDAWTQQAYLKASNAEAGDVFAYGVATDGDTLIVGAPGEDSLAGAAHVFTRTGETWTQQPSLKASNAEAGDYFGVVVDIAADTVVAGAYAEDSSADGGETDNSATDAGAVYVFQ